MNSGGGPRGIGPHYPSQPTNTPPEVLERMGLKRDEPGDDKKVTVRKKTRAKKSKPNPANASGPGSGPPMVNSPPNQIPPVHNKAVSPLITHGHPYSPVRFPHSQFGNPNHGPFQGHYRQARPQVLTDGSNGQSSPRVLIANRPTGPHIRGQMTHMRVAHISNGLISSV